MKNKKAQVGFIIFFFMGIALLIAGAIFLAIASGVISYVADITFPEITNIGVIGDSNISEYAEYGLNPVNTLIKQSEWMGGVLYMIAIIGLIGIAVVFRTSQNKVFIVLFFAFAILMMFLSILMSNVYEDFYSSGDEIGDKLKDQTMLSWLILRSPLVFSVVIFISGIILFSGLGQEEFA